MTRLIDLHTDWMLQYAPETTIFNPKLYPKVPGRLAQGEGYLQATGAAILSCYRNADDWASQVDPWAALGDLITRIEAEFSGRLLTSRDDFDRWKDDRDGLAWGMIGVEGFDALIRSADDLKRLPRLFERGVRLFQPVYNSTSLLAGSSVLGDDRGLTELGRSFLEALATLGTTRPGPRPIVDLAHLNPRSAGDVLGWFEADPARLDVVLIVYSHGGLVHEGYSQSRAMTLENLVRLRTLGGFLGVGVTPPFYANSDEIRASIETAATIPFLGRVGYEGIGLGTDFLGVDQVMPGLKNATEVVAWAKFAFPSKVAQAILRGNAQSLIEQAIGVFSREQKAEGSIGLARVSTKPPV